MLYIELSVLNKPFNHTTTSIQGFKGIRQWLINLCTSPIIIHKITPSVNYNKWLNHLDTELN